MASTNVEVVNTAEYPMRSLVIAHEQKDAGSEMNTVHQINGITRKTELTFEQEFDDGKKDFWVVAWEDHDDLAVYYLVDKPGLLHKLEEGARKLIDQALEDALEDSIVAGTETPAAGTTPPPVSAAYLFVQDVLRHNESAAKIQYRAQYHSPWNTVMTLNCDRTTATFVSADRHTEQYNVSVYVKCRK